MWVLSLESLEWWVNDLLLLANSPHSPTASSNRETHTQHTICTYSAGRQKRLTDPEENTHQNLNAHSNTQEERQTWQTGNAHAHISQLYNPYVHYYCMCVYYLYSNDEPSGSLQDAHWAHEDKELRLLTVPSIPWTLLECWQHQLDCSIHIITTCNPMWPERHDRHHSALRKSDQWHYSSSVGCHFTQQHTSELFAAPAVTFCGDQQWAMQRLITQVISNHCIPSIHTILDIVT